LFALVLVLFMLCSLLEK
jgi:hypothetical protein